MTRKRVLIVAHDFPPQGGGAVMRVVKFVKYLPAFGWEPIILTRQEGYLPSWVHDPSLMGDLPADLVVHRTRSLARRVGDPPAWTDGDGRIQRWMQRWILWRLAHVSISNDWGFRWLPFALPAIRRILRSTRIDAILTTSPPHNVHFLGLWAQRVSGCAWVADFRDGWARDPQFQARSAARNALERRLERIVVSRADFVVSATEQIDTWFRTDYGAAYADKAAIIFNGFDPADYDASVGGPQRTEGPLRIIHTGSLALDRDIGPFLTVIGELAEQAKGAHDGFEVEFVGSMPDHARRLAMRTPGVTITPYQPHAVAIQKMRNADVLMVIPGTLGPTALTGKLFEYMAARRPILALTPPGALSSLIETERLGWAASPDDVEGIKSVLLDIGVRRAKIAFDGIGASPELLARFDRRRLTQTLAEALTRASEARPPRP
jgi:glycosyltransferase involved in cell wall biosynthesis